MRVCSRDGSAADDWADAAEASLTALSGRRLALSVIWACREQGHTHAVRSSSCMSCSGCFQARISNTIFESGCRLDVLIVLENV